MQKPSYQQLQEFFFYLCTPLETWTSVRKVVRKVDMSQVSSVICAQSTFVTCISNVIFVEVHLLQALFCGFAEKLIVEF